MTFLAPTAGLIAGAIAIPALLVLYLLKLRRVPVRVASTLLWQRAVDDLEVNEPFRWLRLSALFFLQLIALLLMCAALARPAIGAGEFASENVVVLIDRSASMNATDAPGGRSRLDVAKEQATRRIGRLLSAGAKVMLMDFGAETRVLTNLTPDRGALDRALQQVTPTDQPGDLERALRAIGAMNAGREDSGLHTVLFSDGGFDDDKPRSLSGSTLEFVAIEHAPEAANTGIVAVGAQRDPNDGTLIRAFARIRTNQGSLSGLPVRLLRNGEQADRRFARFEPTESQDAFEAAVSFELRDAQATLITVEVVADDALDADDRASVFLAELAPPRIELVQPQDPGPEAWVVRDLLEALTEGTLRVRSELETPGDVDLTVYDRVSPRTLPRGDVIVLGGSLPIAGISSREADDRPTSVFTWNRAHPVLRDVSFDGVLIDRWIPTRITQAPDEPQVEDPAPQSSFEIRSLATGADGDLLVEATGIYGQRLLALAFAPSDSTWALDFGFAVFMANAVEWGSNGPGGRSASGFRTSEPASVRVDSSLETARFDGPLTREVEVDKQSGEARLGVLERAGLYTGPGGTLVPVNMLNATETGLGLRASLRVSGERVGRAGGSTEPREIWDWLVLGALALMTAEWLLFGWRMRV